MIPIHLIKKQPLKLKPKTVQIQYPSAYLNNSVKNISISPGKYSIVKRQINPIITYSPVKKISHNQTLPLMTSYRQHSPQNINYRPIFVPIQQNGNPAYVKFNYRSTDINQIKYQPKIDPQEKVRQSEFSINYPKIEIIKTEHISINNEENEINQSKYQNIGKVQNFADLSISEPTPITCPFCLQKIHDSDKQTHKQKHRNRVYNTNIVMIPTIRQLKQDSKREKHLNPVQARDQLLNIVITNLDKMKMQQNKTNIKQKNIEDIIDISAYSPQKQVNNQKMNRNQFSPYYSFPISSEQKRRRIPFPKRQHC